MCKNKLFFFFPYSVPNIETEIIEKKVKLVIVDSIASLFRKEYGTCVLESVVERNNILLEQAAILKDIAQTYDIVVSFICFYYKTITYIT